MVNQRVGEVWTTISITLICGWHGILASRKGEVGTAVLWECRCLMLYVMTSLLNTCTEHMHAYQIRINPPEPKAVLMRLFNSTPWPIGHLDLGLEVEVCLCTYMHLLTLCITNNSSLFEVKTPLCKPGLRRESAVSLVIFPSHSPWSMPKQAFNMTQQNVWAMWCANLVAVYEICVLITVFMVLGLLTVDVHWRTLPWTSVLCWMPILIW